MTKASERQLYQVGGTLFGWVLAQMFDKQDTVPFTVIGGLIGFITGQEMAPDQPSVPVPGRRTGRSSGKPKKPTR